ncbi:MAG: hypothetical protein ACP5FH_05415 [Terracidiphilus sp.]
MSAMFEQKLPRKLGNLRKLIRSDELLPVTGETSGLRSSCTDRGIRL